MGRGVELDLGPYSSTVHHTHAQGSIVSAAVTLLSFCNRNVLKLGDALLSVSTIHKSLQL